jgi:AcrR family transcriptional regulator
MKIAARGETGSERRTPLTRERVVAAAIELADRDGIEAVSMRRLAQELGVEAMSLYTHVRNKEDLLDGMVDAVISEIPIAAPGGDWKASLRQTVLGARSVMLAHQWAPRTIETRTTAGPAVPRYMNAVIGILREGGFSIAMAHHTVHILGSRLAGLPPESRESSVPRSRTSRRWPSRSPTRAPSAAATTTSSSSSRSTSSSTVSTGSSVAEVAASGNFLERLLWPSAPPAHVDDRVSMGHNACSPP